MKVLPFEQSVRPAANRTTAPADAQSEPPDADPARPQMTPDDPHAPDEPGYGHGV